MSSTFGKGFSLSIFGQSHGAGIGFVLDGLPAGLALDEDGIAAALARRNPPGELSTARREADTFEFVSGYNNGRTTGAPLMLLMRNAAQHSEDYAQDGFVPRPSHADFPAHLRHRGYEDARGGGHFSGRLTAPLVAAGEIFVQILARQGILIGAHISRCSGICDRGFDFARIKEDMEALTKMDFPVLDAIAGQGMREQILRAKAEGDSVGGILECAVTGLPVGVGEPLFDSVESVLSQLLFSIPGVKGVEFGAGFGFADMRGSSANDALVLQDGSVRTCTNHAGGINGGLTNGMPLLVRVAVRPTPSIAQAQQSVDLVSMQPSTLAVRGRHDPAIFPRARQAVVAAVAIGLCDLMMQRRGGDWPLEVEKCATD